MDRLTAELLDELREDFASIDANGDGRISFAEFRQLLENLEAGIDEQEARIGFAEIDSDGHGSIEFDEFVAWWTGD